ncbi:DUF308 domain-containing protein [Methanobrevibacter boviskoreani]|jgi:uncharacterized membrane protein HdeD (DUF308 family)|uniref:DUF308 domain-containing protein n=1 Tax=Methanobrevibacter boviskoreani TaxID=1348249 RepID=UPI000593CB5A|nr:DUF308 domain-containing protein [Methanobrevibacter boviskoreani]MCI6930612.1 DUF308 domain-containing protein [Methanobrevibacter boviskoreani]MDD6257429.1 DUF308 domain-containing protein [Methanobrevibacter boviskoreani]MDY5615017.1 DUF308 domain-containing protein [Methanobrevibacter boviskoreani]
MNDLTITGIITIVVGIIILAFPYLSQTFLSFVFGLVFIILGIYYFIRGCGEWSSYAAHSLTKIFLSILSVILGICLIGNIQLFDAIFGLIFWVVGLIMVIFAILNIYYREYGPLRATAIIMLILGIITIILGCLSWLNPFYVALILAISLILDGLGFISAGSNIY